MMEEQDVNAKTQETIDQANDFVREWKASGLNKDHLLSGFKGMLGLPKLSEVKVTFCCQLCKVETPTIVRVMDGISDTTVVKLSTDCQGCGSPLYGYATIKALRDGMAVRKDRQQMKNKRKRRKGKRGGR